MEPVYQITVWAFRCLRCEHEWQPKVPITGDEQPTGRSLPRVCPKCKSPYWDRERREVTTDGR